MLRTIKFYPGQMPIFLISVHLITLLQIIGFPKLIHSQFYHRYALGVSQVHFRDKQASPMAYYGYVPVFDFSMVYEGKTYRHSFAVGLISGDLENRKKYKSSYKGLKGQYCLLRRIKKYSDHEQSLYAGGALTNYINTRFLDYASVGLDNLFKNQFTSLDFAILFENKFFATDRWKIATSLPILTYAIHSGYSYENPERLLAINDFSAWDFLKSGYFTSLDEYLRFQIETTFDHLIKKTHQISLSYSFTFYRFPRPKVLKCAENRFLVRYAHLFIF